MGLLFYSYQWTYCVFLLLWGWMTDRMYTRFVNALSVTIWSIAGMLTGVATTFGGMLTTRLALGAGEAASFPTAGKVVRQWFPASERGLATAISNAGTFAGPAFSAPMVAWLLSRVGWRFSFTLTGSLGFVWVLLWVKFFRVLSECSWLPEEERNYILSQSDPRARSVALKGALLRIVVRKTMWGVFLTQGCCAYAMLLFLFWLPSYLVQSRHMSLLKAGWLTSVPYIFAMMLGLLVEKVSDSLLTHEAVRQGKRRSLLIVFILLSGAVLFDQHGRKRISPAGASFLLSGLPFERLSLNIALTSDLVWNPEMVGTALGSDPEGKYLWVAGADCHRLHCEMDRKLRPRLLSGWISIAGGGRGLLHHDAKAPEFPQKRGVSLRMDEGKVHR
jgi:MFS family permease